jgi:small-conductance mechanosensitive channel
MTCSLRIAELRTSGVTNAKHAWLQRLHQCGWLALFICLPLTSIAQSPPSLPSAGSRPSETVLIIGMVIVGLLGALAGYGMYYLYNETYPSIDDMQRLIHNLSGHSAERGDLKVDDNNPLLKANLREMYETIQHIVDAQNASWRFYLQYVISIAITVFLVFMIILQVVNAEAGLPIVATIVGAAIGSAVQSDRMRPTARPQDPP